MIRSLLSYSHAFGIKAVLSTIRYKIKDDFQREMLRRHIVRGLRILMENTSVSAAYYSNGEAGAYIDMEYDDIVNPKPPKVQEKGQAKESICKKLR